MFAAMSGRMVVRPFLGAPRTGLHPSSFMGQQRRMFHEYRIGMFDRVRQFGRQTASVEQVPEPGNSTEEE